jgi:hypothetical protein
VSTRRQRSIEGARTLLADPRIVRRVTVVSMLLMIPTLFGGLQIDDWVHRLILLQDQRYQPLMRPRLLLFSAVDETPGRTRWLVDHGFFGGWWTDDRLRLNFLRPVSAATHLLDYQLWPDSPFLMHVHSLLWLGAMAVVAGWLYRRILVPRGNHAWVAGLAAVMYALDHGHGVPGAWIAQRNTLISTCLGLLVLVAHDRWRRDGEKAWAFVAPVLLAIALLAGEGAVATMAFLFAYAVCLERGTVLARLRTLVPSLLVFGAWAIAYRHYGFGSRASGMYLDPAGQPVRFVKAAIVRAPLFIAGTFGSPPPDLYHFLSPSLKALLVVIAVVIIALAINAFAGLLRLRAEARFFAIGGALSVLPLCATTPSNRVMAFASFGLIGLLAQLVAAVIDRDEVLPRKGPRRLATMIFAVVAGGGHLVLSPLILPTTGMQMGLISDSLHRLGEGIPEDEAIEKQRLVMINPPDAAFSGFVPVMKRMQGKHAPDRTLILCAGTSTIDLERTDDRTLVVRPVGGFLANPMDTLTRDPEDRFVVGTKVKLTDVTIEVTAITSDGRPAEAVFHFDEPLESTTYRWTKQVAGRLVPFELPAIGGSVHLEAQPLLPL